MTLVRDNGLPYTQDELAASYAHDLRVYAGLTSEEIDERLLKRYPGVMRRWAAEDAAAREQQATQEGTDAA